MDRRSVNLHSLFLCTLQLNSEKKYFYRSFGVQSTYPQTGNPTLKFIGLQNPLYCTALLLKFMTNEQISTFLPQFYIQLVFKAPLCITLKISDQKIVSGSLFKIHILFTSIKKNLLNFILCNFSMRMLKYF